MEKTCGLTEPVVSIYKNPAASAAASHYDNKVSAMSVLSRGISAQYMTVITTIVYIVVHCCDYRDHASLHAAGPALPERLRHTAL